MYTEEQPQHVMQLEISHRSGVDEWYCPICGRRILLQVHPKFKKLVLEPGDEHAFHSASKGDLNAAFDLSGMDSTQLKVEDDIEPIDEQHLTTWKEWMDEVDFDQKWNMED